MPSPEEEIRAVVEERVAAVKAKDPAPLDERQADDIVTFDVLPPLNAKARTRSRRGRGRGLAVTRRRSATTSSSSRSLRVTTLASARLCTT
jgi:ketosteroid isomerase-like protein